MDKAKAALKAELLAYYEQALDDLLDAYPDKADFGELEERVEALASTILPATLAKLSERQGIFPPRLSNLRQ